MTYTPLHLPPLHLAQTYTVQKRQINYSESHFQKMISLPLSANQAAIDATEEWLGGITYAYSSSQD